MEKNYLDPKDNPMLPGPDPDNPHIPMTDEERLAVDMNPDGLIPLGGYPALEDIETQAKAALEANPGGLCFDFGRYIEKGEGGGVVIVDGLKRTALKDTDADTLVKVRRGLNDKPAEAEDVDKYLDPAQNRMIRTVE